MPYTPVQRETSVRRGRGMNIPCRAGGLPVFLSAGFRPPFPRPTDDILQGNS